MIGESSELLLIVPVRDALGRMPTARSEASEAGRCEASELIICQRWVDLYQPRGTSVPKLKSMADLFQELVIQVIRSPTWDLPSLNSLSEL